MTDEGMNSSTWSYSLQDSFIEFVSVAEYFNCPVCMCQLKNTFITPCGHRYCEHCIKECVDRLHKCPCCNKTVRAKELMKDHQFDEIIGTINQEKDKSEKKYFDTLIDTGFQDTGGSDGAGRRDSHFSPVELVLKKHLKESLIAHEKYYQDLKRDVQKQKDLISAEFRDRKEDLYSSGLSAEEISQRLSALQDEFNCRKEELDEDLKRTSTCVAEAYDKYLSENLPSLHILPVTVNLVLLSKNVSFNETVLQPNDSITDIKQILINQMAAKGDKVVTFSDDVKFFSFGPFGKLSGHEMYQMAKDILEHGASHPDIHIIPHMCKPVLQFGLKPGSVIAIYGQVTCESDMPKECFASLFRKGSGQIMDYFTCQDCRFNWICRSCMEACHKNHNVVPYIMKHQPTWACCYCPKKKKCILHTGTASTSRPASSLF